MFACVAQAWSAEDILGTPNRRLGCWLEEIESSEGCKHPRVLLVHEVVQELGQEHVCQHILRTARANTCQVPVLQGGHTSLPPRGSRSGHRVTGDRHSKGHFETGAGYRQTMTATRTEDTTPYSPGHWGRLLGGRKSKLSPKDKCEVVGKDGLERFHRRTREHFLSDGLRKRRSCPHLAPNTSPRGQRL